MGCAEWIMLMHQHQVVTVRPPTQSLIAVDVSGTDNLRIKANDTGDFGTKGPMHEHSETLGTDGLQSDETYSVVPKALRLAMTT